MKIHIRPALDPDMVRQDQDGRAHLTYYDNPNSLSFTWAGDKCEAIQVAQGGYGEPISALIWPDVNLEQLPDDPFDWFQRVCRAYVEHIESP